MNFVAISESEFRDYVYSETIPVVFEDEQIGYYQTEEHKIYLINDINTDYLYCPRWPTP